MADYGVKWIVGFIIVVAVILFYLLFIKGWFIPLGSGVTGPGDVLLNQSGVGIG